MRKPSKMRQFCAIDFFCGGGGMTHGLTQAGVNVIAGIDFDIDAKQTYEFNNPNSRFVYSDIQELEISFFEKQMGVRTFDDNMIFVGCSPCQFYSIINTDKNSSLKSKDLLKRFSDFIEYYRPGYVLVENVPGIETNKQSVLPFFLKKLRQLGYRFKKEVVNMSEYGVPQSRRRFSLMATRLEGIELRFPTKDTKIKVLKDVLGAHNGFPKVDAGHIDETPFNHTVAGLTPKTLERIRKTKHNGGSRFDWADDPNLQLKCFIGRENSFKDTFGRMSWDKPSPTITTKFFSVSNGRFVHPDEDRAISLREGATIQTFPKSYVFKTKSMAATAKLIGNAVPCEFARRLGCSILGKSL